MPDPSSEHEHNQSRSNEGDRHSGDESGSQEGHRRRRRHRRKREKPTSKATILAFAALILIVGAGVYLAIGPRVIRKFKAAMQKEEGTAMSRSIVHLTYRSVIIMNSTSNDWGNATVTVNEQYEAHCPDIPKGTQFEIRLKDFRGPDGPFEPTAPTVRRVTIKVDGEPPIIWDRPIQ